MADDDVLERYSNDEIEIKIYSRVSKSEITSEKPKIAGKVARFSKLLEPMNVIRLVKS